MATEFIKSKFIDWTERTVGSFSLNHIKYIRSFSIQEFKDFFGNEKILVQKHPSGVLYFCTRLMSDYGLVYGGGLPSEPIISVVCEYFGHCFFLLHSHSDMPVHIHINSRCKQDMLNRTASKDYPSYQSYSEYQQYISESYMDAFEGDEDAYWNID